MMGHVNTWRTRGETETETETEIETGKEKKKEREERDADREFDNNKTSHEWVLAMASHLHSLPGEGHSRSPFRDL